MHFKDPGGGDFAQPPEGTHVARCVWLIDLGTQHNDMYDTDKRQVVIGWELPDELIPDGDAEGKPFLVTAFYTQSLHEKSRLRKDLAAWRGRDFTAEELQGFDAKNILDQACMVSVTLNDKGRAKVSSVVKLPKSMQVPERVNDLLYFSLEEFSSEAFQKVPEGFQRMIAESPEYQEVTGYNSQDVEEGEYVDDDGIPF